MESNELMNLVSNLDEDKLQEFVSQSNSNYKIQADIHSIEFDYSWVDMIEETIPYLDNIGKVSGFI